MKVFKSAIPLLLLPLVAGCVAKADFEALQRDTNDLNSRLTKSEREMAAVRNEMKEGIDKSIRDSVKDLEGIRKGSADLQATVDGLRVDLQVLNGKVDDLALQMKKPADDLALLKEDLDRRLTAVEQKNLTLTQDLAALQKKLTDKPAEPPKPVEPEALYQSALEAFKADDMPKARSLFIAFTEQYPKHDLVANATYWLGESYYNDKNYDQAILEFQKVIKNYPDKEKAAAAMLKQGMAFINLKDRKSAKYILKELVKQFPASEEAKRAKDQLKGL